MAFGSEEGPWAALCVQHQHLLRVPRSPSQSSAPRFLHLGLGWRGAQSQAFSLLFSPGHYVQIEKKRSGGFYYEDLQLGVIFHGNPLQGICELQLQSIGGTQENNRLETKFPAHRVSLTGANAIDNGYRCSLRENTKANKQTSKEFSCLCPLPPLCKSHS